MANHASCSLAAEPRGSATSTRSGHQTLRWKDFSHSDCPVLQVCGSQVAAAGSLLRGWWRLGLVSRQVVLVIVAVVVAVVLRPVLSWLAAVGHLQKCHQWSQCSCTQLRAWMSRNLGGRNERCELKLQWGMRPFRTDCSLGTYGSSRVWRSGFRFCVWRLHLLPATCTVLLARPMATKRKSSLDSVACNSKRLSFLFVGVALFSENMCGLSFATIVSMLGPELLWWWLLSLLSCCCLITDRDAGRHRIPGTCTSYCAAP